MFKLVLLGFCGICFGIFTAAGVFTLLSAVGLVPRFIGKTHSAQKIRLYENMIIWGSILGCLYSVFADELDFGDMVVERLGVSRTLWEIGVYVLLGTGGLFNGVFVGCLALAIAEMLDSIPIFARRTSFRHGLGIVVLSMAMGKLCGSFFYFYNSFLG